MTRRSPFIAALLLLALLPERAGAQENYLFEASHKPAAANFSKLQSRQYAGKSTAKTTGTATRVIASTQYNYDGSNFQLMDSTHFGYIGDRGHLPDQFGLADLLQDWTFNSTTRSFTNNFKTINTYNAANQPLTVTSQQWNNSSASWNNYTMSVYTYDPANGNILSLVEQSWKGSAWENSRQTVYAYDASGRCITQTIQDWNTSTASWTNNQLTSFDYISGTSLVSNNLIQTWSASSGGWQNYERASSTYNGKGKELVNTNERYNSSSSTWENVYRMTIEYNATDTQSIAQTEEWYNTYPAPGWYKDIRTILNWNSFGKIDSWIDQNWDETSSAWINDSRGQNTFNTKDLLEVATTDNWNTSSAAWEFSSSSYQFRYYYEDYTLGIPETALHNGSIKIFPVPANQELNIDLQWQDKQAFSVAIYDIRGRVWQQWHMPAASTYKDRVAIDNLPAGNYFIKFSGEGNGSILQQLTVVH